MNRNRHFRLNFKQKYLPEFQEKLKRVPLLKALISMIIGIIVGTLLRLPLYVWVAAAIVGWAMAWVGRRHEISAVYLHLTLIFLGAALTDAHSAVRVIPYGERVWIEMHITDNPTYRSGKSARTSAIAGRWRSEDGGWRSSEEKLLVSFDTMYRFRAGERIIFRGYVNAVSDRVNSYGRLMSARGFRGRTYISEYSHVVLAPVKTNTLATNVKNFQSWGSERLHRLKMNPNQMAVAAAMTVGDKRGITAELRSFYSRTGASHLLAVSGLHVGIVFLLVNALLYLLPLLRYGHIIRSVVAVLSIWSYAAMVGFSPSVIRAAVMFTGAQASLTRSSPRSAVNIMCGTCLLMLAINPNWLFDISFQLSFIAVAAIMAWFAPLYKVVASRWKGLNALWSILIVSFVASVATMPLVSHTFGVFSPVGIIINPVIIFTAHIVVMFSLVWIIIPIPLFEPLFRWLVGGPAWLQNRVVELTGSVAGAGVEYSLALVWVFVIYGVMGIFTAWLAFRAVKEEPFKVPR